jgi:hypothetical protein
MFFTNPDAPSHEEQNVRRLYVSFSIFVMYILYFILIYIENKFTFIDSDVRARAHLLVI